MKLEEKELLLRDLCGRLPYEVKVSINSEYLNEGLIKDGYNKPLVAYGITADGSVSFTLDKSLMSYNMPILSVKPYLFPLSSMTEEQIEEAKTYFWKDVDYGKSLVDKGINCFYPHFNILEFYHKYHLDYRGLIEKGLAIDATGLNIY